MNRQEQIKFIEDNYPYTQIYSGTFNKTFLLEVTLMVMGALLDG